MKIVTIKTALEDSSDRFSTSVAFQMRGQQFTFTQVKTIALKIQAKLRKLGVKQGDRVALLSENRPEWAIAYLAIVSMGAVVVPLDAMLNKEDIFPLMDDSGAKATILSKNFIDFIQGQKILMEEFESLPNGSKLDNVAISLDDLAAIVYTSGTTGVPKGVMLTHKNIMSNVVAASSLFNFGPKDNFLSVLPMHHTFETTAGFLGPFYNGSKITYAESLKSHSLLRNMQETKVTIMCGVPLLYQLFFDGIMREVEEKGLGTLFTVLFTISRLFKNLIGINIGKYLFKMIHAKFGGKIKFFVSGGAAIDPQLVSSFDYMGFTILQGYGLTESSPILAANTLKHNQIGSVGKPLPGVEIRIAGTDPVGEILAFGPNIMKGYYKRKDISAKVVINGWLYTGDVGYLDEEGYLFITGRSKDVIVTSSGVNVYPGEVEFLLNKAISIKESCVMGSKVKEGLKKGSEEVFAIIVPDMEFFKKIKAEDDASVKHRIEMEVKEVNRKAPDFKRIAKYEIRYEELPKTRLKKVKRFKLKKELRI